jgi:hypothetical protein
LQLFTVRFSFLIHLIELRSAENILKLSRIDAEKQHRTRANIIFCA